jgi:hypothetical protein
VAGGIKVLSVDQNGINWIKRVTCKYLLVQIVLNLSLVPDLLT